MDDEVGSNPRHLADIVLGVVRSGELYRLDSPEAESVEPGDRLLYIRYADDTQDDLTEAARLQEDDL